MLESGGDFQPIQFVVAHPGASWWLTGGGVSLDAIIWIGKGWAIVTQVKNVAKAKVVPAALITPYLITPGYGSQDDGQVPGGKSRQ